MHTQTVLPDGLDPLTADIGVSVEHEWDPSLTAHAAHAGERFAGKRALTGLPEPHPTPDVTSERATPTRDTAADRCPAPVGTGTRRWTTGSHSGRHVRCATPGSAPERRS